MVIMNIGDVQAITQHMSQGIHIVRYAKKVVSCHGLWKGVARVSALGVVMSEGINVLCDLNKLLSQFLRKVRVEE